MKETNVHPNSNFMELPFGKDSHYFCFVLATQKKVLFVYSVF